MILADGANSLLAEAEGLRPPLEAGQTALGVKETLALDAGRIDERFGVSGEQGVAWEYVGEATAGLRGAGFLYTNRDSLSVGVVVYASDLAGSGLTPVELLDRFKAHPAVAPLVSGGTGGVRRPPDSRDGLRPPSPAGPRRAVAGR